MLDVLAAPDNVAAFRVAVTLTATDYDWIIPLIERKLRDHEEIGILTDLTGFEDMTGDALARDLQYGLSKFGDIQRFKRAAVISDKQWIKAAMEIMSRFVPQIEARAFPETEKSAAMEWVSAVH